MIAMYPADTSGCHGVTRTRKGCRAPQRAMPRSRTPAFPRQIRSVTRRQHGPLLCPCAIRSRRWCHPWCATGCARVCASPRGVCVGIRTSTCGSGDPDPGATCAPPGPAERLEVSSALAGSPDQYDRAAGGVASPLWVTGRLYPCVPGAGPSPAPPCSPGWAGDRGGRVGASRLLRCAPRPSSLHAMDPPLCGTASMRQKDCKSWNIVHRPLPHVGS